MTWKASRSVLLIGLAATTVLATGCATQDKQGSDGNHAALNSEAAGGGTTSGKGAADGENGQAVEPDSEQVKALDEQSATGEANGGEAEIDIPSVTIPERGITLSPAQPEGALLQIGGKRQRFDWTYTTSRMILPRLQASDYDQDGEDELAVALNVDSGTGLSVDELHIVEFEGGGAKAAEPTEGAAPFVDRIFASEDYLAQLGSALTFQTSEAAGELFGHVTLNGETTKVSLKSFQTGYNGKVTEKLGYGSIVGFEPSANKLIATFGIGVIIENVAEPQYFGEIQADVGYKDGEFLLSAFRFNADEE
ncbi:hypothetical protein ACFSWD_24230 [Paenibacillus xanthanilyticus]